MNPSQRAKPGSRGRSLGFEHLEARSMMSADALVAIAGDWDGDGVSTTGLYDRKAGRFFISEENSPGFAAKSFLFGDPKGIPIAGDWDGNGSDSVGLYYPSTGTFLLRNKIKTGAPDVTLQFGPVGPTSAPLVGDWDGSGSDSIGVFDSDSGFFHLKDSLSPGAADHLFTLAGQDPGGTAISGDWDGNGRDSVGRYNAKRGKFFLNDDIATPTIDQVFSLGPKAQPNFAVIGDWDGDGDDSAGIYDSTAGVFRLKNALSAGPFDKEFAFVASTYKTSAPQVQSLSNNDIITAKEVKQLLNRAAAASSSQDAIIAIVDRGGNILGVRVEKDALNTLTKVGTLVFAIDGAVAKARTGAFFANGDPDNGDSGTAGPLTSRTVRFISQSTVTEREVESNPNIDDPDSTARGPGFVAPIGVGGHFPPGFRDTPPVDLFAIEHTNRDSIIHPGPDSIKGTPDDIPLLSRFNVPPAYIPAGQEINAPESYGYVSGRLPNAQSRGIATLPGGIPLYKNGILVGGIGVFFPGKKGYASYEQGFVPKIGQTEEERTNASRVLEAEWIAFAAAGGSAGAKAAVNSLDGVPKVPGFDLPAGRIDLVGITLEIYGPGNPLTQGIPALLKKGAQVGQGKKSSGENQPIDMANSIAQDGQVVPEGWLVLPHGSGSISTQDVERIINQGIAEAELVRAAIRLQLPKATPGARTRMVLSVADNDGNVLGLYRMQDATFFSIDVAVAKARNTTYYADANAIQKVDRVDDNGDGQPDVPKGVAFTNRTFRFLAEPRYPAGVEDSLSGAFSILRDRAGINVKTAENKGNPAPASAFTSVLGFDAFNPGRNFRDPNNIANQNGIVFFPGSAPLYETNLLVGGFGVSGDGVDQDDVVTFYGQVGYDVPASLLRADEVFVRGVRLPYQKFLRNPHG